MSYIFEQTDDQKETAEKIINQMHNDNEIEILTVKQVRDRKLQLQDFEEFYESNDALSLAEGDYLFEIDLSKLDKDISLLKFQIDN